MQIDPAALTASRRYRLMIDLVVPRPIAFVSTVDAAGALNLAPFSYFMAVASEPPLIALSIIERSGAPKDTARNVLDGREFVVNAATEALAQAVNHASGDWEADVDEFALTGLTPAPSVRVRPPRVAEAPFALECRLHDALELGQRPHRVHLLVGEIVWIHMDEAVLDPAAPADDPHVDPERLRPIARLGRNLYTPLGEVFAMDRPRVRRRDDTR